MNLKHLGDAPDHWKGSLHKALTKADALHDLHALPMPTDATKWEPTDNETYARLLNLEATNRVFLEEMTLGRGGHDPWVDVYLQAAAKWLKDKEMDKADVFLDPTTGIKELTPAKSATCYVHAKTLGLLLPNDSERVLMIYDETKSRGDKKRDHIRNLGDALPTGVHWAAYDAGRSLTMFFATRLPTRIEAIHKALADLLGPCAARRLLKR